MPTKGTKITSEEAEILALRVLAFLAEDEARLSRFLRLTGINPQELQDVAEDRPFLAGVLEHLLADETLLLVFAAQTRVPPESVGYAHAILAGNQVH